MIDLIQVYICDQHGEILEDRVEKGEEIDTERDEIYPWAVCSECGLEVHPKMIDDSPCFEKVEHDRWLWYQGYFDDQST